MAITPFSDDVQVIHKLGDRPIVDNNLTVQQFKDKFDEAAVAIKNYINNTLLPALEGTDGASNTGIDSITGLTATNVQDALEEIFATKEIFWAEYGSTTYDEIGSALASGQLVVCEYGGIDYYYLMRRINVRWFFTCMDGAIYWLTVDAGDAWSQGNFPAAPSPATNAPQMDGSAAIGSSTKFAKEDHVHPSDTSKYEKPVGGIPASDLDSDVQASLGKADTAYQRPSTGIPASALAIAVRTSLNKANSAYQKPANGIPSSDIDPEALPKPAAYAPQMDGVAAKGISSLYAREDHVHPSDASKITMPSGGNVGQVLKKTANGTEWANESGSGGAEEVFWAEYGTTTYSEIGTALTAGKLVLCEYGGIYYSYHYRMIDTRYFTSEGGYWITVTSDNVWAQGQVLPPSAATATPLMDGTAAVGSSGKFAREDHVHPSDTGKADKVSVVSVADAGAVTQALDANKIFDFTGALTSLTITLNAAAAPAQYHFCFQSGSTAPTLTLPNTVVMPSGFQVEANKHYEIDILDGYGAAQSW